MQEGGRRALFDATQRLGANYKELAVLSKPCHSRAVTNVLQSEGKHRGPRMAFYDQQFDLLNYSIIDRIDRRLKEQGICGLC